MAGYNAFSGRSLERVRTLADAVFAVAMTLLVLDLHLPENAATSRELWQMLVSVGPQAAAYVLSFTMLGTFWLALHTVLEQAREGDRPLSWYALGFLFFVTTLPFTASVLADNVHLRLAVVLYWLNLLLLGVTLAAQVWHIARAHLADDQEGLTLVRRRLVFAQVLYALATLLVLASPVAAVIGLAVVQLFFMVSPRIPWRL